MTTPLEPRERIAVAVPIAIELRELVLREAERGFRMAWYDRLRQVVDILETDDDPAEVLKYAGLAFDQLYSGGRNFGDFIIVRPDAERTAAENKRVRRLTGELRELLHRRPGE
ncbi:hypothetical protein [Winogradskya humida]|uniref:Uncharacterized protein n=1 Tax=Winogradskya humida TaxID=113566 RepID=A0ABQ3ZY93_9ACTN|nr:hypothetical protein [Actinoplanes humidus]GIE23393.1 hypothetical protein Ahu01nite_064950 [Actinoplanes humidus]